MFLLKPLAMMIKKQRPPKFDGRFNEIFLRLIDRRLSIIFKDYFLARLIALLMSSRAKSSSSHPPILTHLPGSRSL